ncbi:TonB-dependent receptor domain-containing protein [Polaribacter cellanae]|uniref:TonB-dependent receptor n=1 Tax=Polaribacter cellanae TaxID=2818493 RepID=A0A975CMK7_9FLAO|nr:TonB-dependent receptor [Polaribacter cellanae]QTE21985.1 TonB-dependent receptor [Polaribacter cellanae]
MNLLRTTFFIVLFSYSSYAQIELKGVVKDSSNVAIEFANVVLTNQKNEIIKGTITDEKGEFSLSAKKGVYKLSISFLGYKDWVKEITLDDSFDFGIIILEESKNSLDEVVVTAKKPVIKRKVDRIEFNVNNTILSEGDAWGVLIKAPGVIASSSGSLQIFGKSGVLVMIDERPVQLSSDELKNMLEGMSANEINSIEVITNPPAKYDAEGNGIINITLKKKKSLGYNGNVFSRYTQGVFPKSNNGGGVVYRDDKINISANYNFGIGKRNVQENSNINFLNTQGDIFSSWNEDSDRNTSYLSHNFRTSFDYHIAEKSVIGMKIVGNISPKQQVINKTKTDVFNTQNELDSLFVNNNSSDRNVQNLSYNLNFTQKFKKKGQSLVLDFDYTDYENEGNQNVNTDFFDSSNSFNRNEFFTSDNKQDIKIYSSKLDYTQPIDSTSYFETGIKYNSIRTNNDLDYFNRDNSGSLIFDESRSNQFIYDEDTYAAYLSYNKDFKKFFVKLGLRAEYTETLGNSITLNQITDNDYFELFPSTFLQYRLNDNNSFGFSYSRRIRRPNYSLLNPFQFFSSPFSLIEGNPFLRPSFSDNIELSYSLRNKYFFTGYFNHTKDPFTQLSVQDNQEQIFRYNAVNLDSNIGYGLSFVTSFDINKWWSLYFDLNVYYREYEFIAPDSSNELIKNNNWNFDPYLWNEFTISKENNLSLEITAQYFSPKVQGGFDIRGRSEVSVGIKKKMFQNKSTLSVYVADIFDQNKFTLESNYAFQNHIFRENPENQYVRFSFTYRFGNTKIKGRKRKDGSKDEKNRL